jgi:uncharacterized membrane protein
MFDRDAPSAVLRAERNAWRLGWFSLGLGLAELLVPSAVIRWIGTRPTSRTKATMRAIGIREIACGIGILASPRPARWLWGRVAGDLMDITLLTISPKRQRDRSTAALLSVVGITLLDAKRALELGRGESRSRHRGIRFVRSTTVNRPREEVYELWLAYKDVPRSIAPLESRQVTDGRTSRWTAKGPLGGIIAWEAALPDEPVSDSIVWPTMQGVGDPSRGFVHFLEAPGGRGTEVRIVVRYHPLARARGPVAKILRQAMGHEIAGALRRFKQVAEVGEVVHSDASIHRGLHPARPSGQSKRPNEGERQVVR